MRLPGMDWLKAALIALVVLGHVATGELDERPLRAWIYSFHMPLFLAVSGYLLNRAKLQADSWWTLLGRYGQRMLLPWGLAFVAYNAFYVPEWAAMLAEGRLRWVLMRGLYPYYHLWFVPVLFGLILVLRQSDRLRLPILGLTAVWLLGGAIWEALPYPVRWPGGVLPLDLLGDKRWLTLGGYFFAGAAWREIQSRPDRHRRALPVVLYSGALLAGVLVAGGAECVGSLPALALSLLTLEFASRLKVPPPSLIQWIAADTLFIYLWHVVLLRLVQTVPALHADAQNWAVEALLTLAILLGLIAFARIIPWPTLVARNFGIVGREK